MSRLISVNIDQQIKIINAAAERQNISRLDSLLQMILINSGSNLQSRENACRVLQEVGREMRAEGLDPFEDMDECIKRYLMRSPIRFRTKEETTKPLIVIK